MARPIFAQINLAALASNVAKARERAPRAQLLAVVKADAYGHGLLRVLPALAEADGLALLELDAAIRVRDARYSRRIVLLEGFFEARELAEIASARIAVVVHHLDQVAMLERAVLARPLEVFVKVNSGMNRLGLAPADVVPVCERLSHAPAVAALRLMTHFARADEDDGLAEALATFESACSNLPYPRSLANSAGVFRFGEVGGDIVRPGIMLYGATPFAYQTAESLGLQLIFIMPTSKCGPFMDLISNEFTFAKVPSSPRGQLRTRVLVDRKVCNRERIAELWEHHRRTVYQQAELDFMEGI